MIVIIDYGMGNVGSISNMFYRIGVTARISGDPHDIAAADKLVLPGVGAFDQGMRNLAERGLVDLLRHRVLEEGCPVLGICLGMQLLSESSEEGELPGLGWVPARTVRLAFDAGLGLKIPHMGWNNVQHRPGAPLFSGYDETPRFYFVHSYHVRCRDEADVAGKVHYGLDIHAAISHGHIHGVQFHPEKSHAFGMRLLENFATSPEI